MPDPIYNIKRFVDDLAYSYSVNIDGNDSDTYQKAWISWDFPDADNLHLIIGDPDAEDDIEYTIPLINLTIQGVNYPDQATVEGALNLLFPADPLLTVATDGITIGGDGTPGNPLYIIEPGSI